MSRTWAYLSDSEHKQYADKAESLNMTEGELTQHLIKLFLNTPQNGKLGAESCLNCTYYHMATSELLSTLKRVADFFIVASPPELKKRAV